MCACVHAGMYCIYNMRLYCMDKKIRQNLKLIAILREISLQYYMN